MRHVSKGNVAQTSLASSLAGQPLNVFSALHNTVTESSEIRLYQVQRHGQRFISQTQFLSVKNYILRHYFFCNSTTAPPHCGRHGPATKQLHPHTVAGMVPQQHHCTPHCGRHNPATAPLHPTLLRARYCNSTTAPHTAAGTILQAQSWATGSRHQAMLSAILPNTQVCARVLGKWQGSRIYTS